MTVQLRPTGGSAAELQIRVIQEDLDRDRVIATRDITLTRISPKALSHNDSGCTSSAGKRQWAFRRSRGRDG